MSHLIPDEIQKARAQIALNASKFALEEFKDAIKQRHFLLGARPKNETDADIYMNIIRTEAQLHILIDQLTKFLLEE